MEKLYAAIGGFYNDGSIQSVDAPSDERDVYAKVEEIMMRSPMGTVLADEDAAMLQSCLVAIGCDEQSQDQNGSMQGKGEVAKKAEGCGIAVDARGVLSVESRWHADRKQWTGTMYVTRTGGEAEVKELSFEFHYLSIGKDERNRFIVLYNEIYQRSFNDPYHLADFNGGGQAQASRMDISKFIQCGFYMHVKCRILTADGTLEL